MVETCVGPSELHLKKELTALRKARFLRDPETCSSWRSPLSSKSFSSTIGLNYQNGIHANSTVVNGPGELLEIPSRNGYRRKKVYLYNWRHHSGKSSDSGIQLDEEDQKLSVEGSPEDSERNHHKFDYKSDTNLEVPVNIYSVRGTTQGSPVRRTSRKMKRSAISSKQQVIKRLEVSKLLDLPSSSLGDLDSVEQSDDTPYCNSEDLRQLTHEVTQKNGYVSHLASPFFSGSGRGNWQHSSKILRSTRQDGSSRSYTPASTNSYYRYGCRNPSTVGSWDDTATSFDGDDLDQLDLPGRQGCGLPCYWSKRTRGRGCGGSCSPSLSDILKRKGSSILCGSETIYNKKRPSSSHKQKYLPKSSQGLPLLTNSCDGGGSSVDTESDEQSTNIGEIELEASSRLDGRRWSSCKSQDGLELARSGGVDLEMPDHRSLSQKYRPRSFDDVIGQTIIVHSLSNAILRGRVAPAYLFHGPRGTGKTSTARIFAAALNCLSSEEKRPCGFCRECTHMSSGNGSHVREVDATDKKGIDRVRYMLKKMSIATTFIRYKVFVIDQCHMLSSKMWSAFMMFLEEAPPRVVFIFITIDPENLSRAILSRCQKYLFSKVKDVDIVSRLRKLSAEENLDVELDALDLIAVNSDGSLQDAETMLDQLSLLGKRITTSLVNDLVGVVSDEKLLDLLEIAMSSDTAETVKRSRELMDAGVDPMALMSQIAGLIMDIISGTYRLATSQCSGSVLAGRSLTEAELDRLQQALKILSDAEKQLRLSSERSTWFTAALLQLGSGHNKEPTQSSSSSSKHSSKKKNDGVFDMAEGTSFSENKHHPLVASRESNLALSSTVTSGNPNPHDCTSQRIPTEILVSDVLPINSQSDVRSLLDATQTVDPTGKRVFRCVSPDKLVEIWKRCIQRCHSLTLRQLLSAHGKLLSISETEDVLIAFIAFENGDIKTRAERYLSSITNSLEIVLRHNVEIRIGLVPENSTNGQKTFSELPVSNHKEGGFFNEDSLNGSYDKERHKGVPNLPRQSVDCADGLLQGTLEKCESSLVEDKGFQTASFQMLSSEGINGAYGIIERGHETSVLRTHMVAIDDQRLESTWLQAAEKNTSRLTNHSNAEKSLVLLQHNVNCQKHVGSSMALAISSKQWEDELNHELKALKNNATQGFHEKQIGGHVDPYVISPSLLHSKNFTANFDRENLGYESGPTSGCNGLFCWNTHKARREKGAHVKSQKTGRLSLFGQCGKSKAPSSRLRR